MTCLKVLMPDFHATAGRILPNGDGPAACFARMPGVKTS